MSYNQLLNEQQKVFNHEGAASYRISPEMELYTLVCSMAMQPKFYETPQQQVDRLSHLVSHVDAEYVAKLAVYARQEMGLRSVPILLVVELARYHSGDNLVSRTINKVILRADEIMELLMCYQWRNPKEGIKKLGKLSNQIRIGLQDAFNRFDEYQFAKYDNKQLRVKLRDALFIAHPKAKDDAQQILFDKIVNDELQVPYTWETELSQLGQLSFKHQEAKDNAIRQTWEELVMSGKLGYMALLRNLRNILNAHVNDDVLQYVADRISDEHEVRKAKQFPFRYLSAYKELMHLSSPQATMLLNALEQCTDLSALHVQGFLPTDRVMLACDMSGSMKTSLSCKSNIKLYEVGNMLAMLLQSRLCTVVSGIFADDWKVVNLPQKPILSNTLEISRRLGEVGYGTQGGKPLEWLIQNRMVLDKVMFFTDCQFWGENNYDRYFTNLWDTYKQISPNAHLYLFNLAGYRQVPILLPRKDVTLIAGWSDHIFDILAKLEMGHSLIAEIMTTKL